MPEEFCRTFGSEERMSGDHLKPNVRLVTVLGLGWGSCVHPGKAATVGQATMLRHLFVTGLNSKAVPKDLCVCSAGHKVEAKLVRRELAATA